jgi:hypothetical protein
MMALKRADDNKKWIKISLTLNLSSFATDTASQLNVFGHDGNSLGVNGTQVGIFKETHEISLAGFRDDSDGVFLTPPVAGALLRAALVASCFRGALPPVDLRAVCLVRAMFLTMKSKSTQRRVWVK